MVCLFSKMVIVMIRIVLTAVAGVVLLSGVSNLMAIEEAEYSVVMHDGKFELRDYKPYILAQVTVEGEFEAAGNKAFRDLFKYISGNNRSRNKVAMTAPVTQQDAGEEISMTAPVTQQESKGRYVVSFMMPASYTMETLPEPNNPAVRIRQVPSQRMATVRYSGTWSKRRYDENKSALDEWIKAQGLKVNGEPVWARYNSPFSLWFLRRNEVLLPVEIN